MARDDLSHLLAEAKPTIIKWVREAAGGSAGGGAASGVGVTDHGALTGLGDDDHPQYLNVGRGDTRYYTQSYIDALDSHARLHTLTSTLDHALPAGASALDVLGAGDDGAGGVQLAMLSPASDVQTANQNSLLRDADGVLGVAQLNTPKVQGQGGLILEAFAGTIVTDDAQHSSNYSGLAGGWINWYSGDVQMRTIYGADEVKTPSVTAPYDLTLEPPQDLALYPVGNTLMDGVQKYKMYTGEGLGGAYIDWPAGDADFGEVHISTLTADAFYLKDAEVWAGHLIVGVSASQFQRPFTIPAVGATGTAYVKNIPGAGDMPVFRAGDDLAAFYYDVGDGGTVTPARIVESKTAIAYKTTGTGGTILDEDWESYSDGASPPDWKITGKDNSLSTAPTWEIKTVDGTKALATDPDSDADKNFNAHWNGTGASSLSEIEMTGRCYSASNVPGRDIKLMSKYVDVSPTNKFIRIRQHDSGAWVVVTNGYDAPDGGTTNSGFHCTASVWTHFRIRLEDDGTTTTLYARFWNEGDTEPASWQINCYWTGASRPQTGTFGFGSQYSLNNPVYFDDILVTNLGATATGPSITLSITDADYMLAIVQHEGSDTPAKPGDFGLASYDTTSVGNTQRLYTNSNPSSGSYTFSAPATTDWMSVTLISLEGVDDSPVTISRRSYVSPVPGWSSYGGQEPSGERHYLVEVLAIDQPYANTTVYVDQGMLADFYQTDEKYGTAVYTRTVEDTYLQANYGFNYDMAGVMFQVDFKSSSGVPSGVQMGMAYFEAIEDNTTSHETDEQVWTLKTLRGPSRTGVVIGVGAGIHDLGVEGDAYWEANVVDGLSGGPYSQITKRNADPWDKTSVLRLGYLGGTEAAGGLGLFFNQDNHLAELSEYAQRLRNIDIELEDGSGNLVLEIDASFGVNVVAGSFSVPKGYYSGYTFRDSAVDPTLQNAVFGGLYADITSTSGIYQLALDVKETQFRDSYVTVQANNGLYGNNAYALFAAGSYSPSLDMFAGLYAEAPYHGKTYVDLNARSQIGYESEVTLFAHQGVVGAGPVDTGITINSSAAGVRSISLEADDITTESGYSASSGQDVATLADTVQWPNQLYNSISYTRTYADLGSGSAGMWVKLLNVTFGASNYRATQIRGDLLGTKNNSFGADAVYAVLRMAGSAPNTPVIYASQFPGADSEFTEIRAIHTTGTGTTAEFEIWVKAKNAYARFEVQWRYYDPIDTNITITAYNPTSGDLASSPPTASSAGYASAYPAGWVSLPYGTGWADYGTGYSQGRYRIIGDMVELRGLVKRTSGTGTTIATLPVGYRPTRQTLFSVITNTGTGRVDALATGIIKLNSGGSGWVSLDGLAFSIAD